MRRKEQNRVKQLAYRKKRDDLNLEFKEKLEENERLAAEKTEKKRLKRAKKKKKGKNQKKEVIVEKDSTESESDSDGGNEVKEKIPKLDTDPLMQEPTKKDPLIIYYN